ncbi:hypothetical protein DFP72DRAFT_847226 [Ephemerocybe angulata]|uniref:Uncharacterized protein n=1 Tax=Ephemerocybe angulata TaxID=980116 RepID=A0A8H6I230_9AGAR|nr:hypothetical protein DFP72DRAFT_847226 [Tulosesus angulatus]
MQRHLKFVKDERHLVAEPAVVSTSTGKNYLPVFHAILGQTDDMFYPERIDEQSAGIDSVIEDVGEWTDKLRARPVAASSISFDLYALEPYYIIRRSEQRRRRSRAQTFSARQARPSPFHLFTPRSKNTSPNIEGAATVLPAHCPRAVNVANQRSAPFPDFGHNPAFVFIAADYCLTSTRRPSKHDTPDSISVDIFPSHGRFSRSPSPRSFLRSSRPRPTQAVPVRGPKTGYGGGFTSSPLEILNGITGCRHASLNSPLKTTVLYGAPCAKHQSTSPLSSPTILAPQSKSDGKVDRYCRRAFQVLVRSRIYQQSGGRSGETPQWDGAVLERMEAVQDGAQGEKNPFLQASVGQVKRGEGSFPEGTGAAITGG